jgi:hypothetical protein
MASSSAKYCLKTRTVPPCSDNHPTPARHDSIITPQIEKVFGHSSQFALMLMLMLR